jgi:hypothetical protein
MLAASCAGSSHPNVERSAKPAGPTYPPELDQVAQKLFGGEPEVIAYGDLAKNGRQEALIINRIKKPPEGIVPGTLITRAAILEKDGKAWKEVFLCDQHLKNPKGYLGGIPLAPVNGWRLQSEQDPKKGLIMYFTPLQKPSGGNIETIGVRWNPTVKRYESLDRNYENFLNEITTLQPGDMTPEQ